MDETNPTDQDVYLWGPKLPGFRLKVTPAGGKSHLFQHRIGGRGNPTRRYTLGKHGPLTHDQACTRGKAIATLLEQGIDPKKQEQEAKRKLEEKTRLQGDEHGRVFRRDRHLCAHGHKSADRQSAGDRDADQAASTRRANRSHVHVNEGGQAVMADQFHNHTGVESMQKQANNPIQQEPLANEPRCLAARAQERSANLRRLRASGDA